MWRRVGAVLLLIAAGLLTQAPAEAADGGIQYRQSQLQKIRAEKFRTQKVACPAGTRVISGGVRTFAIGNDGRAAVVTSAPFDSSDNGKTPDDGWIGVARNAGPEKAHMQTFAVCAESGQVTYLQESHTAFDDERSEYGLLCPEASPGVNFPAVGGGVRVKAKSQLIEMSASIGADDIDGDLDREDGWYAGANNGTAEDVEMIVYAICAHTGTYTFESGGGTLSMNTGGGSASACQLDTEVAIGGGIVLSGSSGDAHVTNTSPEDYEDDDKRPDDFWGVTLWNGTGATLNFVAARICKTI